MDFLILGVMAASASIEFVIVFDQPVTKLFPYQWRLLINVANSLYNNQARRLGPTKRRPWSGSKLFDIQMWSWKNFLKMIILKKNSADDTKSWKISQHAKWKSSVVPLHN